VLTQAQSRHYSNLQESEFLSYFVDRSYGAGSLGTDALGNTVLDGLSFEASQLRGYYFSFRLLKYGVTLSR